MPESPQKLKKRKSVIESNSPSKRLYKYVNDGRPPDKAKKLVPPKGKSVNALSETALAEFTKKNVGVPSYRYNNNSCWLDTSLQLLYTAISYDFDDFITASSLIDDSAYIQNVLSHFKFRQDPNNTPITMDELGKARDRIREMLVEEEIIRSTKEDPNKGKNPVFVSLMYIFLHSLDSPTNFRHGSGL